ncbi:guanine nucleotide binding protein, alpha subunit [Armillaria mellea]|nr:guanine nucleotide binding protein, alpha subunit [Armillaria mellea]
MIPYEGDDPLTLALAPPPDETAEQKEQRESAEAEAEAEAQRRSDQIDEEIRKEQKLERRKVRPVKLMLLGQSESGKTTTLKHFQLKYARREWAEERLLWKLVIFFNLVRNVNGILDILAQEMSRSATTFADSSRDSSLADESPNVSLTFKETHRLLKLRLEPLRQIQTELERRLGNAAVELKTTDVMAAAPFGESAVSDFSMDATNGWKTAFDKLKMRPGVSRLQQMRDEEDAITDAVTGYRGDMKAIWEDPVIREMLARRRNRIEDGSGFFLNDAERIAVRNYQPTDDDIIRARLRTLGVQEYNFIFDQGRIVGQEWRIYDVGGTQCSRVAWYPYFDNVDAIIFLAPISCFDEKLAEDRRVNRLEDSYMLWKSVCACKYLRRTQIILFLNKCDLLHAKLTRGVKIRHFIPSYGDRANNLTMATKYFQRHFGEISRQISPVRRPFFSYMTSLIDTRRGFHLVLLVEHSILLNYVRRIDPM